MGFIFNCCSKFRLCVDKIGRNTRLCCCDSSHVCSPMKGEKQLSRMMLNILWTTIPSRCKIIAFMVDFSPTKFKVQWIKCIIKAFLHVRNRVWNCSANTTPWLSAGMPHHHAVSAPSHSLSVNLWYQHCLHTGDRSGCSSSMQGLVYCIAAMYSEVNVRLAVTSSSSYP